MKIAINGLGRIGRKLIEIAIKSPEIEIIAINDLMPIEMAVYFLKYDSTYGHSNLNISYESQYIIINQLRVFYSSVSEIEKLDWQTKSIDIAINCSGTNKTKPQLEKYHDLGIPKVILSSPPDSDDIPIVIKGYNHFEILPLEPKIISNASCTTYCVAPILDIVNRNFGIEFCNFTTIHCYTSDQNLQDAYHTDFRRSRAAGVNIIPTTTSATKVIKQIFPELADKISGSSFRVPVINGSITEFIFQTKEELNIELVNSLFQKDIDKRYKNIVQFTEDKIVSSDVLNSPYAALIDRNSLELVGTKTIKLTAFYDNESGYTHQLVRLIKILD